MSLISLRFFSGGAERVLLKTRTPGLYLYENFLDSHVSNQLLSYSIDLRAKIDQSRSSMRGYQPSKVKAQEELSQRNIALKDQYRILHCEDFQGVAHFHDNYNIPLFIACSLITEVCKLPLVSRFSSNALLNWHFTLKTERTHEARVDSLLDEENPVDPSIAMIYNLGANVLFQIKDPQFPIECETFRLPPNSLLVLSGRSRLNYQHMVIPLPGSQASLGAAEAIHRIALELVCAQVK